MSEKNPPTKSKKTKVGTANNALQKMTKNFKIIGPPKQRRRAFSNPQTTSDPISPALIAQPAAPVPTIEECQFVLNFNEPTQKSDIPPATTSSGEEIEPPTLYFPTFNLTQSLQKRKPIALAKLKSSSYGSSSTSSSSLSSFNTSTGSLASLNSSFESRTDDSIQRECILTTVITNSQQSSMLKASSTKNTRESTTLPSFEQLITDINEISVSNSLLNALSLECYIPMRKLEEVFQQVKVSQSERNTKPIVDFSSSKKFKSANFKPAQKIYTIPGDSGMLPVEVQNN